MKPKDFDSVLKSIGEQLAVLREKKGFPTIKEFAHHYGLPEIHYWRIESGKANMTLKSLVRILHIHKLSITDFFCLFQRERKAA